MAFMAQMAELHRGRTLVAITRPVYTNGRYYGSTEEYALAKLQPSNIGLLRIHPSVFDTPDDATVSPPSWVSSGNEEGMWVKGNAGDVTTDGVDLTAELIGVNDDHKELERTSCGHVAELLLADRQSAKWPNCVGTAGPVVNLAPVFAPIAATWLDRSVMAAMASVQTWTGMQHVSEIDPQGRSALRRGARSGIELTRYYVRSYALLASCEYTEATGGEFCPDYSSNPKHISLGVNNMQTWIARLVSCANGSAAPLYYDANTMSECEDMLPLLGILTAPQIVHGGAANWLWPDIHGTGLVTNAVTMLQHKRVVDSIAIKSMIDWLITTTGTDQQAKDARDLVDMLVIRPKGQLLFGSSINAPACIPLPRTQTAGQMLLPCSLWATTFGTQNPVMPNSNARQDTIERAKKGAAYVGLLHLVAAKSAPSEWWDKRTVQHYKRYWQSQNAITNVGWVPNVKVMGIMVANKIMGFPRLGLYIRPMIKNACRRLAVNSAAGTLLNIGWMPHCDIAGRGAGRFIKIEGRWNQDTLYRNEVKLRSIAGPVETKLASAAFSAAGCEVGYMAIDLATTALHQRCYPNENSSCGALPTHLDGTARHVPVARVKKAGDWLNVFAILKSRCNTIWYTSANHRYSPEEDTEDQTDVQGGGGRYDEASAADTPSPSRLTAHTTEGTGSGAGGKIERPNASEEEGREPTEQPEAQETREPIDIPPTVIAIKEPDVVTQSLIDWADQKLSLRQQPAHHLKEWRLPAEVSTDNDALNWYAKMIPLCYEQRQSTDLSQSVRNVLRNIGEQTKLNSARESAKLADLAALSLLNTKTENEERIRAYEEALLPGNGVAPAAQETAPPQEQITEQSITGSAPTLLRQPTAGGSQPERHLESEDTLEELAFSARL
jgi:hypothetical protein